MPDNTVGLVLGLFLIAAVMWGIFSMGVW